MATKLNIVFLLWMVSVCALIAQSDEEFTDVIYVYPFSGKSEAIQRHLERLNAKGRFHGIFLVPMPRSFVWGEALIRTRVEQFRKSNFRGSLSVIVRGRRYWADAAYVRENRWGIPAVIDADGKLLKSIKAWDIGFPLLTIWDSTGTLWWWAPVESVPSGNDLPRLLDSLERSTAPMISKKFMRTTAKPFIAESVGRSHLSCSMANVSKVVPLQDDSTLAVGPLFGPAISGNGKWFAAMDFHRYSVRIYQLPEGKHEIELRGDTVGCRGSSWYVPDSTYHYVSRYLWSSLAQPVWSDSILWTINVLSYVCYYSKEEKGIDKKYYLLSYCPPGWGRCAGAEFKPMTRTYCTGEYCAEGTFHPGGGFVLSKGRFYLPFRRGYLAMGSDSSMVKNPYENPLRDTFYTYAPLYGAFNSTTGQFLDSTIGELDEWVGKRYGLGLSLHDPWHLSCDQQSGLCAWVQWLVPAIEMSDGRSIPLLHYWNESMLDSQGVTRRSGVPTPREVRYLRDSAGADIRRIILTPGSVFVLWKVKERGFPLVDEEHGLWVLQEYDRIHATLKGEWQLPALVAEQHLRDVAYDAAQNRIAGLYQNAWKTSLAYYELPVHP
ncbi:MAG: hypothetical protein KatS3mg040_1528 [Candidatus Kapaibacterium sp.]|nr:MAG: hypothetical protein KatS3mg040_1528 [Candidatus Kapabacteria bacterium]